MLVQMSLFFFSCSLSHIHTHTLTNSLIIVEEYELENPSYYKDSDTAGEQDPSWFQSASSWLKVNNVYKA